jgi:hypothetical protein
MRLAYGADPEFRNAVTVDDLDVTLPDLLRAIEAPRNRLLVGL